MSEVTAAPSRDPVLHRLVATACRAVIWTMGHMPAFLAYLLADLLAVPLALWAFLHDRRGIRSKGFHRNVRIVFRPGGPAAVPPPGLLWGWARHMTWMMVDFCRTPQITRDNLERYVELPPEDLEQLMSLYREGKGLILATGHIGLPELGGHAASLHGLRMVSVYQPSPIPALDRVIARVRTAAGQTLVPKWGVVDTLKKALGRGEAVAILADVSSKGSRVFAPFLGTQAATNATPALMHLATGSPIAVATVARLGRMRYRLHVWRTIRHPRSGDRKADVQSICEQMNAGLSDAIMAYPRQWFWHGRRFRHRPPGEVPDPDGLPPLV